MKTCPRRDLATRLHSTIIHSSPQMDTAQLSIHRWVDKQVGVSVRWVTTLQLKNPKLLRCALTVAESKNALCWEKVTTHKKSTDSVWHDFVYIKLLKRQVSATATESRSVVAWGWARRGWSGKGPHRSAFEWLKCFYLDRDGSYTGIHLSHRNILLHANYTGNKNLETKKKESHVLTWNTLKIGHRKISLELH